MAKIIYMHEVIVLEYFKPTCIGRAVTTIEATEASASVKILTTKLTAPVTLQIISPTPINMTFVLQSSKTSML